MPLVIKENENCIGAYKVVGRKLPQLCIQDSDNLEFYGEFYGDNKAQEFMKRLAEFMGAKTDEKETNASQKSNL